MIKSIATSPKATIRQKTTVAYDFTQVLQDIPAMDRDVNKRIQKYEECQSLSLKRADHIRSR